MCELKCMSASVSRYPRNPKPRDGKRAVDRRADGLTQDYARKAREVDWQHCGTPRPPPVQQGIPQPPRVIGPVERKLLTFGNVTGWVFGAWGEASEDVHTLVHKISEARVEVEQTLPGQQQGPLRAREARMASVVGYVRRSLSFTTVQQQARLLLSRLQLLGPGEADAARRRGWALRLDQQSARERRAQAVCLRQGHNIVRRGFGMMD